MDKSVVMAQISRSRNLCKSASLLPLNYVSLHFTICSHLKSVNAHRKKNSILCKLYLVYEEIPAGFLDETDVDNYFFHNILDLSQSHHRIVQVIKGSNKKSLAFKVLHFCDSKLQQRFILKEELTLSEKELESLIDNLGEFLKAFDQANKVSQIPLPNLN